MGSSSLCFLTLFWPLCQAHLIQILSDGFVCLFCFLMSLQLFKASVGWRDASEFKNPGCSSRGPTRQLTNLYYSSSRESKMLEIRYFPILSPGTQCQKPCHGNTFPPLTRVVYSSYETCVPYERSSNMCVCVTPSCSLSFSLSPALSLALSLCLSHVHTPISPVSFALALVPQ